jgi:hypothetical protein
LSSNPIKRDNSHHIEKIVDSSLFPLRMPDEVNTSVEFKSRNCGNRAIVGAKPSQSLHNCVDAAQNIDAGVRVK